MQSNSQRAATVQSFGFIMTEVSMMTSLLYCLATLRYTQLFLILIPLTLAPVVSVSALFFSGAIFNTALGLLCLCVSAVFAYTLLLLFSYAEHSTEMLIAGETLGFYTLIGFLLVQIGQLLWTAVLMFQLASVSPSERLLVTPSTSVARLRLGSVLLLIYSYTAVLLASSLLNFDTALDWTHFYVALFLPYGAPFLMLMMLFKSQISIRVGTFMLSLNQGVELIYLTWLLICYPVRSVEMADAGLPALVDFWLLVASFLVRAAVLIAFHVLLNRASHSSFADRFAALSQPKRD